VLVRFVFASEPAFIFIFQEISGSIDSVMRTDTRAKGYDHPFVEKWSHYFPGIFSPPRMDTYIFKIKNFFHFGRIDIEPFMLIGKILSAIISWSLVKHRSTWKRKDPQNRKLRVALITACKAQCIVRETLRRLILRKLRVRFHHHVKMPSLPCRNLFGRSLADAILAKQALMSHSNHSRRNNCVSEHLRIGIIKNVCKKAIHSYTQRSKPVFDTFTREVARWIQHGPHENTYSEVMSSVQITCLLPTSGRELRGAKFPDTTRREREAFRQVANYIATCYGALACVCDNNDDEIMNTVLFVHQQAVNVK
jgi:hypothetical protein